MLKPEIKMVGPVHPAKDLGEYRYVGSVDSIYDDTPGGLDDLYYYTTLTNGRTQINMLRVWGGVRNIGEYRAEIRMVGSKKDPNVDPYWEPLLRVYVEKGGCL